MGRLGEISNPPNLDYARPMGEKYNSPARAAQTKLKTLDLRLRKP